VNGSFYDYIERHRSFLLLGASSASYFFAMVVARKTLDADGLYFWNVLVTLVSMSFSFCFFGAEQVFLRQSTVMEGRVEINRTTLWVMAGALLLFTVLLAAVFEGYFFHLGGVAIYLFLAVCVGIFVFVYNFLRLRRSFSAAQLAANGWKFTILPGVLLAPFGNTAWSIMSGFGLAAAGAIWLLVYSRKSLVVTDDLMPVGWKPLFFGYSLSLLVLMVLNNADRLIISRYGSQEQFSEYVYLVTLLLLPFSLLSNYFGFREMAHLKRGYDRRLFARKVFAGGALTGFVFVPWFGLIYAFQEALEVPIIGVYALPGMVIVTCRSSYALLSALFALKARPEQIYIANLLTLLVIVAGMSFLIVVKVTITSTLLVFAAFWSARIAIYAYFSVQVKEYKSCHAH